MSLTYGKQKDWVEDTYTMLDADNSSTESNSTFGNSKAQYPQEVVITCEQKNGRVRAPLSGPLDLNVHANWEPAFGNGGIASMTGLLGTINGLSMWSIGATIQQPWMNRKTYKSTTPFSFSLPLTFVTIDSAADDVVRPCLALASFLYPRKYINKKAEGTSEQASEETTMWTQGRASNNPVAEALTHDKIKDGKVTEKDTSGIVGSVLNAIELWEIPGPPLVTKKEGDEHPGDIVDIIIGNMFTLSNCYLEDVQIEFGNSYDRNGYPLYAKATLKVTCADSVVCDRFGNMLVNEIYDATEKIQAVINAVETTTGNLMDNMKSLLGAVKGFWSPTSQTTLTPR